MSYLQTRFLTHRQQVLKLYKAAVKNERNWFPDRYEELNESKIEAAQKLITNFISIY
jgi:hypothetical protein